MKYENRELLERLAAEYVLGTLARSARRRFEGLMRAQIPARRAVTAWERRLAPLATGLAPVAPPARVWERISAELGLVEQSPRGGTDGKVRIRWAAIAAGMAVLAVVLGVLNLMREPQIVVRETVRDVAHEPRYVAIVADAERKPVWLLNIYPDVGELHARAIAPAPLGPTASYELWMLPDDASAPVSLGLLPEGGDKRLPLDALRLQVMAATSTLAVSREPAGGSPTGAPTGPVLYTAPLVRGGG